MAELSVDTFVSWRFRGGGFFAFPAFTFLSGGLKCKVETLHRFEGVGSMNEQIYTDEKYLTAVGKHKIYKRFVRMVKARDIDRQSSVSFLPCKFEHVGPLQHPWIPTIF